MGAEAGVQTLPRRGQERLGDHADAEHAEHADAGAGAAAEMGEGEVAHAFTSVGTFLNSNS